MSRPPPRLHAARRSTRPGMRVAMLPVPMIPRLPPIVRAKLASESAVGVRISAIVPYASGAQLQASVTHTNKVEKNSGSSQLQVYFISKCNVTQRKARSITMLFERSTEAAVLLGTTKVPRPTAYRTNPPSWKPISRHCMKIYHIIIHSPKHLNICDCVRVYTYIHIQMTTTC